MSQSQRKLWVMAAVLLGVAFLLMIGVWSSAPLSVASRRLFIVGHVLSMSAATVAANKAIGEPRHRIVIESLTAMFLFAALTSSHW